jgi:hypothetical protein
VALEDDRVPVTVGLDGEKISLVAGDVPIGEWPAGEYLVIDLGEGTFVIEAEDESLSFHPDDPGGFARSLGGSPATTVSRVADAPSDTIEIRESPPPKPATLVGFYALVVITAALGIWAFLTLI